MSRIEQLIDEIEEFLEGCKKQTFSQSNIIVPKDELLEMLNELRLKTPEEVKNYKKIIANRDQIISDAQTKAENMVEETRIYVNSLVEEHEIMLKAYERAEALMNQTNQESEITIQRANEEAEEIRKSALLYTQSLLNSVEKAVADTYEAFRADSQGLISHLEMNLDTIKDNKQAIMSQVSDEEEVAAPRMTVRRGQAIEEPEYAEDDEEVIDDELLYESEEVEEEEEEEEEETPAPKKRRFFGRSKKTAAEEIEDYDPNFDFDDIGEEPAEEEEDDDDLDDADEEISGEGDTIVLDNYDDIG